MKGKKTWDQIMFLADLKYCWKFPAFSKCNTKRRRLDCQLHCRSKSHTLQNWRSILIPHILKTPLLNTMQKTSKQDSYHLMNNLARPTGKLHCILQCIEELLTNCSCSYSEASTNWVLNTVPILTTADPQYIALYSSIYRNFLNMLQKEPNLPRTHFISPRVYLCPTNENRISFIFMCNYQNRTMH